MASNTFIPHQPRLQHIGAIGEQLATDYLIKNGFTILDRNVYCRWGELDIIAEKHSKVHFIEVKTRIHTRHGMPYEAIRIPKLTHLMRAIQHYILLKQLHRSKLQLDVISIILNNSHSILDLKVYENVHVDRFY
jgi:putative endonuclease